MTNTLILFDIDGVCSDDSKRVHYAVNKQWGDYFARISEDTAQPEAIELAQILHQSDYFEIQYLTGRRIDLYEETKRWLSVNGFPNPERITMRGFADRDILARYKGRVIQNALGKGEYLSVHLYEDDPAVVNHVNTLDERASASLVSWYTKQTEMVTYAEA